MVLGKYKLQEKQTIIINYTPSTFFFNHKV